MLSTLMTPDEAFAPLRAIVAQVAYFAAVLGILMLLVGLVSAVLARYLYQRNVDLDPQRWNGFAIRAVLLGVAVFLVGVIVHTVMS